MVARLGNYSGRCAVEVEYQGIKKDPHFKTRIFFKLLIINTLHKPPAIRQDTRSGPVISLLQIQYRFLRASHIFLL